MTVYDGRSDIEALGLISHGPAWLLYALQSVRRTA
jgi:hypothetical protein